MKTKRIFAILLAVMFIIGAFPMTALATTAPTPVSAAVSGATLTITFETCPLDTDEVPPSTAFTLAGTTATVSTVAVPTATTVTLTLSAAIPDGTTGVTVTYAGTELVCEDDVPVAGFGPLNVTVPAAAASNQETQSGGGGALIPAISFSQLREATLPTSNATAFNFVLDPQGLYYLSDDQIKALVVDSATDRLGEIAVLTECTVATCSVHATPPGTGTCNEVVGWRLLPSAGQIIFSQYAPYFVNNSNFDMALDIALSFTATGGGGTAITTITDPATVNNGTNPQVFIGASFSDVNVNAPPTEFSLGRTLPVTTTAQKPLFILGAADYNDNTTVTRDSDDVITAIAVNQKSIKADGNTGHGTQFRLAGRCNPNANWEAALAGRTIGINVVFELTSPAEGWEFTDDEKGVAPGMNIGAAIPGVYGLFAANSLTATDFIEWTPPVAVPVGPGFKIGGIISGSPNDARVTAPAGTAITLPFDFDGGVLQAVFMNNDTFNATGLGFTTDANNIFFAPSVTNFPPATYEFNVTIRHGTTTFTFITYKLTYISTAP